MLNQNWTQVAQAVRSNPPDRHDYEARGRQYTIDPKHSVTALDPVCLYGDDSHQLCLIYREFYQSPFVSAHRRMYLFANHQGAEAFANRFTKPGRRSDSTIEMVIKEISKERLSGVQGATNLEGPIFLMIPKGEGVNFDSYKVPLELGKHNLPLIVPCEVQDAMRLLKLQQNLTGDQKLDSRILQKFKLQVPTTIAEYDWIVYNAHLDDVRHHPNPAEPDRETTLSASCLQELLPQIPLPTIECSLYRLQREGIISSINVLETQFINPDFLPPYNDCIGAQLSDRTARVGERDKVIQTLDLKEIPRHLFQNAMMRAIQGFRNRGIYWNEGFQIQSRIRQREGLVTNAIVRATWTANIGEGGADSSDSINRRGVVMLHGYGTDTKPLSSFMSAVANEFRSL